MKTIRALLVACSLAMPAAAVIDAVVPLVAEAQASEIKYVVNGVPVTSYDIERRSAFLRLQRKGGNVREKATEEMIDQALRLVEAKRLNIEVSDQEVDAAFERFSSSNKMKPAQMSEVLGQAGVTTAHFKEFIRSQIGWSRAMGLKFRATGRVSEQDAVQRMLEQGGEKPTATEYFLQQVIFVVPEKQRGKLMTQRRKEANALRARFQGCDSTREFAKGLLDVTVRDLGRVLEPALPPDWADHIKDTKPGSATAVRDTQRGVEFIGVCSTREVSDDRVAQMLFTNEGSESDRAEELSKEYMKELRDKAQIVKR